MVAPLAARSMATGASMTKIVMRVRSHGLVSLSGLIRNGGGLLASASSTETSQGPATSNFLAVPFGGGALPGQETCRCAACDDALDSLKAKRGFGTRYGTPRPGVLRRGKDRPGRSRSPDTRPRLHASSRIVAIRRLGLASLLL
jgi:hypothetical protein